MFSLKLMKLRYHKNDAVGDLMDGSTQTYIFSQK